MLVKCVCDLSHRENGVNGCGRVQPEAALALHFLPPQAAPPFVPRRHRPAHQARTRAVGYFMYAPPPHLPLSVPHTPAGENLQFGYASRVSRQILTSMLSSVLILLSTSLIVAVNSKIHFTNALELSQAASSFGFNLLTLVVILGANIALFIYFPSAL